MQAPQQLFQPLGSLHDWMISLGLNGTAAGQLTDVLELLVLALLAYLAHIIGRAILVKAASRFATRTQSDWDDVVIHRRVFHRLALFAPAIVVWRLAPAVFQTPELVAFARASAEIFMLLVALLVVDSFLSSANDIYQRFEVSRRVPILGYLQVVKILITLGVVILAVSIVLDKSPWFLLSGLGALTAIILLIFKDSILGLVAGIQLVANDMLRPGDWIEMPRFGADGDVMEITLNTVKVRNWDKTITTIPTYALISDSFVNWRGMSESGGRRIKRSVYIDVSSIKFCTPEMIEKFSRIQALGDYIGRKQQELAEHNRQHSIDESVLVNGRRMTNIGTFRAYLSAYLRRHPKIHQEMTFLIRHLQPTDKGLPIEIYVFSNDQAWANYEAIQADIFDHIFAALPEFELRPFQSPAGGDVAALGEAIRGLSKN